MLLLDWFENIGFDIHQQTEFLLSMFIADQVLKHQVGVVSHDERKLQSLTFLLSFHPISLAINNLLTNIVIMWR